MSIRGFLLGESTGACPYISGNLATHERLVAESLGERDLEELLAAGYRHFGNYFFRPVCSGCHLCVPLRVTLTDYRFPRSGRRLLNRNARFSVTLERPHPSPEAFELYLAHKLRFEPPPSDGSRESYEEFVDTFFQPLPFAYQLSVFDGTKLIAVSHLDMTDSLISAVYCYYDDRYRRESLGSYAVFKEIEIGLKRNLDFVYLGYYVGRNAHMSYKIRFRPNQILREEGLWEDLLDTNENFNDNIEELGGIEFIPKHRLKGGH